MELLTVSEYAAREGLSVRTVRDRAAVGRIKGAQRIGSPGSPWVLPWPPLEPDQALDDVAPDAGDVGGGSDRTPGNPGVLTAGYDTATALTTYTACVSTVGAVTTRPARALPVALAALVASIARHSVNRDGVCGACGWTYPCPDAAANRTALDAVASIVLDGAA